MSQYFIPFLLLTDLLLYGYTKFYLSIHMLMDTGCSPSFPTLNNAKNIHMHVLCRHMFSSVGGLYQGVELLGPTVTPFLTVFLSGCTILYSTHKV